MQGCVSIVLEHQSWLCSKAYSLLVEEELGAEADGEVEPMAGFVAGEVVEPDFILLLPISVFTSLEKVVFDPPEAVKLESAEGLELESPEIAEVAPSPPKAASTRASPIFLSASLSLPDPNGTVDEAAPAKAISARRKGSKPRFHLAASQP